MTDSIIDNFPRVAQLILEEYTNDCYELVINKGSADGIAQGDRFLIYGFGQEIHDPITEKPLGLLEIVRGRGVAIHVQDAMATIRTIEDEVVEEPIKRNIENRNRLEVVYGRKVIEEIIPAQKKERPFRDPQVMDIAKPF